MSLLLLMSREGRNFKCLLEKVFLRVTCSHKKLPVLKNLVEESTSEDEDDFNIQSSGYSDLIFSSSDDDFVEHLPSSGCEQIPLSDVFFQQR